MEQLQEGEKWWEIVDLKELYFRNNKIRAIPHSFENFCTITRLSFDENLVDGELAPAITSLTLLQHLSFSGNRIDSLTASDHSKISFI